jgi:hypothetical protein
MNDRTHGLPADKADNSQNDHRTKKEFIPNREIIKKFHFLKSSFSLNFFLFLKKENFTSVKKILYKNSFFVYYARQKFFAGYFFKEIRKKYLLKKEIFSKKGFF